MISNTFLNDYNRFILILLIMAAKRTSYKLLKYGDPFLTKVCQPVVFPLADDADKIIDECQNTLVKLNHSLIFVA